MLQRALTPVLPRWTGGLRANYNKIGTFLTFRIRLRRIQLLVVEEPSLLA